MNPYQSLPSTAFWKPSVGDRSMYDIEPLWEPKFKITKDQKVATFGSCFAQHFGRALRNRGFDWLIAEMCPSGLNAESRARFNYNVFSARTGNIYTTTLLKQWTEWALNKKKVPGEIWQKDGRFFDPFRPRVEPNGFASEDELQVSRNLTLAAFRRCIEKADYFVFTMGLTESWVNRKKGYEYPMCPGTVAGEFDERLHQFRNQQFDEIHQNLIKTIKLFKKVNPGLKVILTVSPVPLTATKSHRHVLVATMASKSILRAVADQVSTGNENVDYFPSYEIINSPFFRGGFFNPNQRTVNPHGVDFVMNHFFTCLVSKYGQYLTDKASPAGISDIDEVCEEELLAAFGKSYEK